MSTSVSARVFLIALLAAGSAFAGNITVSDQHSSGTGWYGTQEDQEVEAGCTTGQQWDLEAFYLENWMLTMVSGYDFNKAALGQVGALPGDLFIDVNGDAQFGDGTHAPAPYPASAVTSNSFGYDFVVDFDFLNYTYDVYQIASAQDLQLQLVNVEINDASNPYRYLSGGTSMLTDGAVTYQTGLSNWAAQNRGYNVTGGTHTLASIDLSWLESFVAGPITFHYTMECGNDLLMGYVPTTPEPATLALIGIGLAALGARRRFAKQL